MRALVALVFAASSALAQTAPPGSELTISLMTMGNGDQVWELFGHNAIVIHDASRGTDAVYNWGVFDRDQPYFIPRFLQGRMLYSVAGYGLDETMMQYRYLNRSVFVQELNLTPAQRLEVRSLIELNQRPENVNYRYDYFRDNCSTRVRDLLDRVLGGQIRGAAFTRMAGTTYRQEALRLMQVDKPLVAGVDIALGRPTDREITTWENMFLPEQLRRFVSTLQVTDGSGNKVPLVKSERVLFQSSRPPEPTKAPRLWIGLGAIGAGLAALLLWTGTRAGNGRRRARLGAAVALGLWSLVAGLLGLILALLWGVTDHAAAHRNENLLLFNPLWLVLAVTIPTYLARGRAVRATRVFALAAAALACIAPLLHLVRLSAQDNFAVILLALPPALAVAWVVTRPAAHVRG